MALVKTENMMPDSEKIQEQAMNTAVAEGGAYEILSRRLADLGRKLAEKTGNLNERRLTEFGKSELTVAGRLRIRTENNCRPRDLVQVGGFLLFGYNVFLGLKKETRVEDVFSLYQLEEKEGGYEALAVPIANSFLDQPDFLRDFSELYTYYKDTTIQQLSVWDGKLLASFKIGQKSTDVRVFRWQLSRDGSINYIDNRGERDIKLPPAHDFEWIRTSRENAVSGRHPHMNILDTVFVETVGGDLTVKIENNTEDGLGIYREDVLDKNQSLDDGQIEFAKVGNLIILKILPYREKQWRYLVYNSLTHDVRRIDAIGQSCIQLPEDHGLIFPGGYYLQNGDYKSFDQPADLVFRRMRRSPNGEDVLYVFCEPEEGRLAILKYNLIERKLASPILGNGYSIFDDGRMILFEFHGEEPTRIHPTQIWKTPFYSDEFTMSTKIGSGPLSRIGNADLVRGISDLGDIIRKISAPSVSLPLYHKLVQDTKKLFDAYFWMNDEETFQLASLLREIVSTSELVVDEYEKVENIRRRSEEAIKEAVEAQSLLLATIVPDSWEFLGQYTEALENVEKQRGRLISLKSLRYADLLKVANLEEQLVESHEQLVKSTAVFLAGEKALLPFAEAIEEMSVKAEQCDSLMALTELENELLKVSVNLDILSTLISDLSFDDAREQTRITENISEVYARANQTRARFRGLKNTLGGAEEALRFAARFKLFGQSVAGALSRATTPDRCDDELARLLVEIESLESQFGQREDFLADIIKKREEILELFEIQKQTQEDARQRKARALFQSAERILETLPRRSARFTDPLDLNAFFVSDPMVRKLRELVENLRALGDTVLADDIEARIKASSDQSKRGLRDKNELFDEGGSLLRLGPRYRFTVNTQELDLTLIPRDESLYLVMTGTDYQEKIDEATLLESKEYWGLFLESESPSVSRAEYLAYQIIEAARKGEDNLSPELLARALATDGLAKIAKDFLSPRYREGYEKGIHDFDAALILSKLLPLIDGAGLLRFNPASRALAMLFWQKVRHDPTPATWVESARTSYGVGQVYQDFRALEILKNEMEKGLVDFIAGESLEFGTELISQAALFLAMTLARQPEEFDASKYAKILYQELKTSLENHHLWSGYADMQRGRGGETLPWRWRLMTGWLRSVAARDDFKSLLPYVEEAAALAVVENTGEINVRFSEADLNVEIIGLISSHQTIVEGRLKLSVDDFFTRLGRHQNELVPGFHKYQEYRAAYLESAKERLRLSEYKARPLSTFVRNRLIDQVYLPVIGDNMAKQLGAAGEAKRSDLSGLFMLISPPGYGKTTLMEYVAHALGLIFMKINGPSLGHSVVSLDPSMVRDAAAKKELEKLSLALEMGNNVMLYIDDIQHTSPEFLEKFISLGDATRRIEGVWQGKSRTYDLKGKRFCLVMAGNPYTESGELFKIPDMLSNRADIYNLGEVLGGMDEAFALSYIENSLTSNPILAPLVSSDMEVLDYFLDLAMDRAATAVEHGYSPAEEAEIVAVLKHLLYLRETVMLVNRQYIDSAAQSESYREEPPFKLQGSYRNMNKLAAQVSAVMNRDELDRLLDDMYISEAQLLTGQAEENLLKLAELRGKLTEEQSTRLMEIRRMFLRGKVFGGDEADIGQKLVLQLADLSHYLRVLGEGKEGDIKRLVGGLNVLAREVRALGTAGGKGSGLENSLDQLVEVVKGLSQNRKVVKVADLMETVQQGYQNKGDQDLARAKVVTPPSNVAIPDTVAAGRSKDSGLRPIRPQQPPIKSETTRQK